MIDEEMNERIDELYLYFGLFLYYTAYIGYLYDMDGHIDGYFSSAHQKFL